MEASPQAMEHRYESLSPVLHEPGLRLFAATEARAYLVDSSRDWDNNRSHQNIDAALGNFSQQFSLLATGDRTIALFMKCLRTWDIEQEIDWPLTLILSLPNPFWGAEISRKDSFILRFK